MKSNYGNAVFFLIVTLNTIGLNSAHAGRETGNGGGAVACRATSGAMTYGSLDLWEASRAHLRFRPVTASNATANVEDEVERVRQKIGAVDPFYLSLLDMAFYSIEAVTRTGGIPLPLVHDSNPLPLPANCHLEQAMIYTINLDQLGHEGFLSNSQGDSLVTYAELVNKLPVIDQAAMKVHEAIYKLQRAFSGDTDSDATRRIVGRLFSEAHVTQHDLRYATGSSRSLFARLEALNNETVFRRYFNPNLADYSLLPKFQDSLEISGRWVAVGSNSRDNTNNEQYNLIGLRDSGNNIFWSLDILGGSVTGFHFRSPRVTDPNSSNPGYYYGQPTGTVYPLGADQTSFDLPIFYFNDGAQEPRSEGTAHYVCRKYLSTPDEMLCMGRLLAPTGLDNQGVSVVGFRRLPL